MKEFNLKNHPTSKRKSLFGQISLGRSKKNLISAQKKAERF
jgi:hypothetical protein